MSAAQKQDPPPTAADRWSRVALLIVVSLGLAIRLVFVGAPPIDGHHVQQADTASMARIMARDGITLWTPRIGWAGPEAGPVEAELPLYPAIVAAGWIALPGEPAWWARLLSVLAWFVGGVGLHRILRRRLPDLPAALGLGLYALSPLGVLFSRSIQPDALAVAMLIWAWERADASRDGPRAGVPLLHAALLLGLAAASRGPLAAMLPVLAFAGWQGLERLRGRDALVLLGVAALPPLIWFMHAHALGIDGASFKLWGPGSGRWSTLPTLLSVSNWQVITRHGLGTLCTPLGAILLFGGLSQLRAQGQARVAAAAMLTGLVATASLLPAFVAHEYFLLPLLPFASVLAGLGAQALWSAVMVRGTPASRLVGTVAAATLLGATVWVGAGYLSWGFSPDERLQRVAEAAKDVVPPRTAIVVVDRHPQTLLYAIDQTGWHRQTVTLEEVRALRGWGAAAMLITDSSPSWQDEDFVRGLLTRHPLVARGANWSLLRLDVSQGTGKP